MAVLRDRRSLGDIMKVYIGHFIDYNFKRPEQISKPYLDYELAVYFCSIIAENLHLGFWIEEKEL